MARILTDQNSVQCPDYELPEHTQTILLLATGNTSAVQAVQLLKDIWQLNNNRDKLAWQQLVDTDLVTAQTREQQLALSATPVASLPKHGKLWPFFTPNGGY
ncbi:hypothetical protein FIBSPDRAFT_963933 [Athelia psychrophila]|uniref:Uncharacterized protein n=1 Tax=Athelia psychrophila TaxID=1759441 RepID=A0A165YE57_9AGAM|nr:hypothetical protein FIBSPDRAFT_963933 [Fibularhizoctonia sp. CBS 109695]